MMGPGVERGEEGGRAGVVLGQKPHLLGSRPKLEDRGATREYEEGATARGLC